MATGAPPVVSSSTNPGVSSADPATNGTINQVALTDRPLDHPVATAFHFVFKAGAFVSYFFGSDFVLVFIFCVLFSAFDFWTVKNVTGRLLVGLRWWNQVKEDGTSQWVFESRSELEQSVMHPTESRAFWLGMYIPVFVWGLFAVFTILNPKWLLVCAVPITLLMANLVGYRWCSQEAVSKTSSSLGNLAKAVEGFKLVSSLF
eukprot:gnl/Spiro4/7426_TR3889_c0_g1_i1.p1 gnl/Spiro4/7426_TR3889_c0_g1~~gnl/Spiro4/7426_TR3889_c0_g1_i1.p1  ORF type:complete len:203 (+),score=43.54 gnl/Spiro4/7426_TR3889_c0_g1_i1:56-664(+)